MRVATSLDINACIYILIDRFKAYRNLTGIIDGGHRRTITGSRPQEHFLTTGIVFVSNQREI